MKFRCRIDIPVDLTVGKLADIMAGHPDVHVVRVQWRGPAGGNPRFDLVSDTEDAMFALLEAWNPDDDEDFLRSSIDRQH